MSSLNSMYRVSIKSGHKVKLHIFQIKFKISNIYFDVEWAARSPDLSPLDFFFWSMLKKKVYSTKITDSIHLTQ